MNTKTKYILAFDPGITGGYALLEKSKTKLHSVGNLEVNSSVLDVNWLKGFILGCLDVSENSLQIYIEKPFLAQGSNDTMYTNYGRLLGTLESLNLPFVEVRPQQWLKGLGLTKKEVKKPSTLLVPKLFPEFSFKRTAKSKNISDGQTDAVAIGLYAISLK